MRKGIFVALLLATVSGTIYADYISDREAAVKLQQARKTEEAMAAFVAMAEGKVSDYQKSDALEQAALCALTLRKYEHAEEFAGRIPLAPVTKSVQMRVLIAQKKGRELVENFGNENLNAWPETVAGNAFYARGIAYAQLGDGARAEADLKNAAELITEDIARAGVLQLLGDNYRDNLKAEDKALQAYMQIVEKCQARGNSVYFQGVLSAAKVLSSQEKFAEAEAVLTRIDMDKLKGYWHGVLGCALGDAQARAGQKDRAAATYQAVLRDEQIHPSHRKSAEAGLAAARTAQ